MKRMCNCHFLPAAPAAEEDSNTILAGHCPAKLPACKLGRPSKLDYIEEPHQLAPNTSEVVARPDSRLRRTAQRRKRTEEIRNPARLNSRNLSTRSIPTCMPVDPPAQNSHPVRTSPCDTQIRNAESTPPARHADRERKKRNSLNTLSYATVSGHFLLLWLNEDAGWWPLSD